MTYVFSGTLNPTQSILREFRAKQWLLSGLNRILKKIDERGSIERMKCAGRLWSVHCDNTERFVQLVTLKVWCIQKRLFTFIRR